ncbi:MAG: hypothetical protein GY822_01350 [Deltaproteobacteria bacterium]|nr:hypothetical protein [Deltaproteobacteria bacterium]
MTNLAASQACCFNLFVPLAEDLHLASALFSRLLSREISVSHIEIEFTPNTCDLVDFQRSDEDESLGDQQGSGGTDADVAVFLKDSKGRREVILIETKFIEAEFSACNSVRAKSKKEVLRVLCSGPSFYDDVVKSRRKSPQGGLLCGYLKYRNWELTTESKMLNLEAIIGSSKCPFAGSAQQIWRNILLAERVAEVRALDDQRFWVVAPQENVALWEEAGDVDVEKEVRNLLTPFGEERFERITFERIVETLKELTGDEKKGWLAWFSEKYLSTEKVG